MRTTENFLPRIDGSTITLAHLLQLHAATHAYAMLLGPEIGMREYAGARLLGTFGMPLRVYAMFKIK
jgi:preprotein translocase subunit Sec63